MAEKSYHVIVKADGRWSVIRTGAVRASGIYPTQEEAEKVAREMAIKAGGGELIIHRKDGTVRRRDSFDNDLVLHR